MTFFYKWFISFFSTTIITSILMGIFSIYFFIEYSQEMEAYLQDAETIGVRITNTEIRGVTYDWERNRCIIQIADEFFPVHEFYCTAEWTSADCVSAIQSLVDNQ